MSREFWKMRYENLKFQLSLCDSVEHITVVKCNTRDYDRCPTVLLYDNKREKYIGEIYHETHCKYSKTDVKWYFCGFLWSIF